MHHENTPAARELVHDACQPLTRAARANLPAKPDDSHAAFHWSTQHDGLLRTEPMSRTTALAFDFDPARYVVLVDDEPHATLLLADVDHAGAEAWLDDVLVRRGMKPANVAEMPYTLPFSPDWSQFQSLAPRVAELGRAYAAINGALTDFIETLPALQPGPSPVTLWPHHFDMATLVQLVHGDAETAPSIGVGFSPGDDNYAMPYLYCSPYPQPGDEARHDPPPGWQWHTQGFVSLVLTTPHDDAGALANDFRQAFQVAMTTLPEGIGA
ncbi:MAG: hypothetical protein AAFZ58_08455 [Pseudomonadota bacterium]